MKWVGRVAVIVGLIAVAAILLAGPGYQAGWWHWRTAFSNLFPVGVYGGFGAILLGLVALIAALARKRGGALLAVFAVMLGAAAAAVPLGMRFQVSKVPMIHDITTDTTDPPRFSAVVPLRADAQNPPEYDPSIANEQRDAYPDITTIRVRENVMEVMEQAQSVVESLGWELVEVDSEEGRIEATDSTTWFGFKDDVVVRVRRAGPVTAVDVRSKSREGRSDLGKNADRIREFRHALLARLTSSG